jgi:hypothetical protein
VLGVGSVEYLPVSKDPPDLEIMPMGWLTVATLPELLAPAEAFSIISCTFMWVSPEYIFEPVPAE